jgi:hypothetical protein
MMITSVPLFSTMPGEQQVQNAAQGINVGAVVSTPGVEDFFWRHVVHGAENASGLG